MFLAKVGLRFRIKPLIARYVSGELYAEHLRAQGYAIGESCSIPPDATLPIPALIRIGSNVRFSSQVSLLTYEGSIAMLNRAYGKRLDRVGPIVIRDNVFIGRGAIIKYGVTLGPNVVVGAHSVVTRSFRNAVVAGNPARELMSCDDFVAKVERQSREYPWYGLIQGRGRTFDGAVEPALNAARSRYFFPDEPTTDESIEIPAALRPELAFG